MLTRKREKKSETIEVRVAYSQKRSFMDACKRNGKNASNVIRDYVDAYTKPKRGTRGIKIFNKWVVMPLGIITMLVIFTGLGFVSLTFSSETNASLFKSFDVNADGVLTSADATPQNMISVNQMLQWADTNSDGQVSRDEFETIKTFNTSGPDFLADKSATEDAFSIVAVEVEVGTDED